MDKVRWTTKGERTMGCRATHYSMSLTSINLLGPHLSPLGKVAIIMLILQLLKPRPREVKITCPS